MVHQLRRLAVATLKRGLRRGDGKLEDLLGMATKEQPLFIILEISWNSTFEEPHLRAYQSFLEDRLPELACGLDGNFRLLVLRDFYKRKESFHHEIERSMLAAEHRGIRFAPMAEVEMPRRGDVEVYLKRLGFFPGDPEFDRLMKGYDRIEKDPRLSFEQLSRFLDRELGAELDGDWDDEAGDESAELGEEEYD